MWINTYGLDGRGLAVWRLQEAPASAANWAVHAIEHYTELKTVWLNMA